MKKNFPAEMKKNTVKPKKSKNDIFRSSIGVYLKQKNYVGSDKFRKSDFMLLQNKKQFIFEKMLEVELNNGNCFGYSNVLCITNNQHIVDQQFGRFSQFIESQSELLRSELRRFYGPMVCHLYMELMKAREQKAAADFLKKHAHLVAPVDSYDAPLPTKINGCSIPSDAHGEPTATVLNIRFSREANITEDPELNYFIKLIQTLCMCTKLEAAESDQDVAHFRSSKYEIHTTEAVVDALRAYLQKCGHVLILNLLYTWIHVHIIENEVPKFTEDNIFLEPDQNEADEEMQEIKVKVQTAMDKTSGSKRKTEEQSDQIIKTEKTEDATDTGDKKNGRVYNVQTCLQTLRESREQLMKAQTEFPRFIKLADKCKGLTSAHLDSNECHLVAGFNNSVVQLWQMNQQTCRGKNLYRRLTDRACRWEASNSCQEEEEEEVDNDIKVHARASDGDRGKRKFEESKYESNSYNEYGGIQLRGHGLGVTDVRFSAHYPLIYSVSKDTTIRTWRADSYACASIYRGHRYPIWCIDESPVGMYMATGSKDLTARLWSLEHQFPLITYAGHTQDVECLAFHPNGNYIATGSADLSVRLWCVTSGKLMRVFADCKQPVTSVAFSPDGKMLAVGGEETKIRIFDLAAGSQLNELKEHSSNVTSIAWNGNSRQLASVCRDGSLRLWDVKKLTPMNENNSSSSATTSSASPNRLMALSSNCQRFVKVFLSHNDTICCIGN